MDVTQWIKESCDHQEAKTPEDYIGMAMGYSTAVAIESLVPTSHLTIGHLETWMVRSLFSLVKNDPDIKFRMTPVTFADGGNAVKPEHIVHQLTLVLDASNSGVITANEFYQHFEKIHPCHDGNGRVGALLYNWYNGTLGNPVHPPEFQKD